MPDAVFLVESSKEFVADGHTVLLPQHISAFVQGEKLLILQCPRADHVVQDFWRELSRLARPLPFHTDVSDGLIVGASSANHGFVHIQFLGDLVARSNWVAEVRERAKSHDDENQLEIVRVLPVDSLEFDYRLCDWSFSTLADPAELGFLELPLGRRRHWSIEAAIVERGHSS